MTAVGTYLFLPGTTAEAFEFYRTVFGTEYAGSGPMRYSDAPDNAGVPDDQAHLVMHVGLPILGDHLLMGTDSQDHEAGDNVAIMLMPETREEADELFAKLSEGGTDLQPMEDKYWGDYWGSLTDRYGICWQIDVEGTPPW